MQRNADLIVVVAVVAVAIDRQTMPAINYYFVHFYGARHLQVRT